MADEKVIESEVSASEGDVAAVRSEMTTQAAGGAMPGAPIDRIPYNAQLAAMVTAGTYSKRIANTDRCIRLVSLPIKGGSVAEFHCSRPCVGVGDQRLCPDHDKSFFQPNQSGHGTKGRILNSSSIDLSAGEIAELTKTSKSYAERGDIPQSAPTAAPGGSSRDASEPRIDNREVAGSSPAPGQVRISFSLEELAAKDVLKVFQNRVCEALDSLPCANVRQMKQVVAIQAKVAKITRRKGNERITESSRTEG